MLNICKSAHIIIIQYFKTRFLIKISNYKIFLMAKTYKMIINYYYHLYVNNLYIINLYIIIIHIIYKFLDITTAKYKILYQIYIILY